MDALVLPSGIIVVVLVLIRLGVLSFSSIQQHVLRTRQQQLSLALLQARVDATKRGRETSSLAWNGYRKFVIEMIFEEAVGVRSFLLVPHDEKPLPPFKPGQYLTFRLKIPGREKPAIRCYSISDRPKADFYRITVKRVMSPVDVPAAAPGLVSSYFHEQLAEGDILDVQAPRGHFYLDDSSERPVVLIAGGVGITPLLSMVNSVAEGKSGREILLFYGVRNQAQHAFKAELSELTEQHPNVRMVVCYSKPTDDDEEGEGRDYHHSGWITIELLKSYLQSTNYQFYLCGPPAMMETLTGQLAKWGVADKDILTEAFGPATVSKAFGKANSPAFTGTARGKTGMGRVTFARSGKHCDWTAASENLLDLASANGVTIESGCRAGNCGTCVVAIKSGRVSYLTEYGMKLEEGTCLTCIAAPAGDLVLDA